MMKRLSALSAFALPLLLAAQLWAVTLATDNANRADENPIVGWTTISGLGNLQIVGNEIRAVSTGTRNGAYHTATSPANDQWASAVIASYVDTASSGCVVVRVDTGAETYYAFCISYYAGFRYWELSRRSSGTFFSLDSANYAFVATDTIRIEAEGTTIRGFINGAQVTSQTDANIASGRFGIVMGIDAAVTDVELDDWSGGDFTSAASAASGFAPIVFE